MRHHRHSAVASGNALTESSISLQERVGNALYSPNKSSAVATTTAAAAAVTTEISGTPVDPLPPPLPPKNRTILTMPTSSLVMDVIEEGPFVTPESSLATNFDPTSLRRSLMAPAVPIREEEPIQLLEDIASGSDGFTTPPPHLENLEEEVLLEGCATARRRDSEFSVNDSFVTATDSSLSNTSELDEEGRKRFLGRRRSKDGFRHFPYSHKEEGEGKEGEWEREGEEEREVKEQQEEDLLAGTKSGNNSEDDDFISHEELDKLLDRVSTSLSNKQSKQDRSFRGIDLKTKAKPSQQKATENKKAPPKKDSSETRTMNSKLPPSDKSHDSHSTSHDDGPHDNKRQDGNIDQAPIAVEPVNENGEPEAKQVPQLEPELEEWTVSKPEEKEKEKEEFGGSAGDGESVVGYVVGTASDITASDSSASSTTVPQQQQQQQEKSKPNKMNRFSTCVDIDEKAGKRGSGDAEDDYSSLPPSDDEEDEAEKTNIEEGEEEEEEEKRDVFQSHPGPAVTSTLRAATLRHITTCDQVCVYMAVIVIPRPCYTC